MHIPDNYLSPSTCAVMSAAMVPVWIQAVKSVEKEVSKKKMPLLGIGAAFSFLVMMFNIPLPGGTTGHAVGAVLLAVLIGPYAACIAVTIALLIQALLFGDGGIIAFGANAFNLAFIMSFAGYYIYKFIKKRVKTEKGEYYALFIAAYIGLNTAALLTAIEFGIQPMLFRDASNMPLFNPYPLSVSIPAMLIPHLTAAGILEGIITAGVYQFIKNVSPGMIDENLETKTQPIYLLLFTMIWLSPIGLLASGTAWGEWGTEQIASVVTRGKVLGFIPKGMQEGFHFNAAIAEYSINRLPEYIGYILSAAVGVTILLTIFKLITIGSKKSQNI